MDRSYRLTAFVVLALSLTIAVGCGGNADDLSDEGLVPTGGTGTVGPATLVEVKSDGTATITGTVTYDGEPPVMGELSGPRTHADVATCTMGNISDQTWIVDSGSKGVANVVVWVAPPSGQYFKKPDEKTWEDAVVVDQPRCAFVPHVVVLYPQTFNCTEFERTGQVLRVMNSAPIGHNIRVAGSSQKNPSSGGTVAAEKEEKTTGG